MTKKRKGIISFAVVIMVCIALYNLWSQRPVKVLYIDSYKGVMFDIVVDHLPWLDRDRINWFLTHREELEKNHPTLKGNIYEITFLDVGAGFMSLRENPHEDLLCFDTIKEEKNCIEKNTLLVVHFYNHGVTDFDIGYGGPAYQKIGNGKIERKPD
jgi:hypothetical protein